MEKVYDIIVVGGGLSGFACAVKSAQNGKSVLLVERRPVLGWESTWAYQLDFHGDGKSVAKNIINTLDCVGGFSNNRTDAPILEMTLDRLANKYGISVLLYSYPVRLISSDDKAFGVVIGNKSGEHILKARIVVDATEEAILWKQTEPYKNYEYNENVNSKQIIFFNHAEGNTKFPTSLGDGITIYPSIWQDEVFAEFDIPKHDVLLAKRMIPDIIKRIRAEVSQLKDSLVSHTANEPFPIKPLISFDRKCAVHPKISNFFGAGIWLCRSENTVIDRINLGEDVGNMASKCEGVNQFPEELMTGSILFDTEESISDAIVVGGGTGGAIAGISAGREGAKTMLIEASPILGGIGTGGAIHSYYHGVRGGIQDEVDQRLRELTPLFAGKWRITGFNPEAKKIVLQQMLEEANVDIKLNTVVSGAITSSKKDDNKTSTEVVIHRAEEKIRQLTGVIAVGPNGSALYNGKVFIDSTGDGDVAVMAGAPFQIGRERDNLMHAYSQPCGNLAKDGGLSFMNFDAGYVDPTDVEDLTRGRRAGINIFWKEKFTDENRLLYIAPIIGLRQSRQIIGEYQLTLADEISGRQFPDVVSYTVAHYDNHGWDFENDSDEATLWVWALGNWSKVFGCEVPYRCMIPKNVDGLLLACRAISMTYDAHMEFRMQNDIQRLGEVAGISASLSAKKGITPRELDIKELQSILKEKGFLDEKYRPKSAIPLDKPLELPASSELSNEAINDLIWLSTSQRPESALVLRGLLNSDNPIVRFKSSSALAVHGLSDGFDELFKNVTERVEQKVEGAKTVPIWQSSIPFLGMIGDKRAIPAILGILKDKNANLDALIASVRALERIGDDSVIPALWEFLKRDDLPTERVLQISTGTTLNPVVDDAKWQIEIAVAETMLKLGST
ncbi:TPA: FAD-dependent oxidoreductase, partial [bacterium]|nr:FAD-dependent oxidoreductase [bacterium]